MVFEIESFFVTTFFHLLGWTLRAVSYFLPSSFYSTSFTGVCLYSNLFVYTVYLFASLYLMTYSKIYVLYTCFCYPQRKVLTPEYISRSPIFFCWGLKGDSGTDFRLQVFIMIQFPPGPRVSHWGHFKFLRKISEIFAILCLSPVSTTSTISCSPVALNVSHLSPVNISANFRKNENWLYKGYTQRTWENWFDIKTWSRKFNWLQTTPPLQQSQLECLSSLYLYLSHYFPCVASTGWQR